MTVDRIDCLVIGAGVVGLAIARELAMRGREVAIVERETAYGSGVSSRSSEVVHAGLYDTPGWWKAMLAVEGNALLAAYCESRGVGYRRCGKLVMAGRAEDLSRLEAVKANGDANGVPGLTLIDRDAMRRLEPELDGVGALWSPTSGIVDTHALMTAYLGDAERHGASLVVATAVESVHRAGDAWQVAFAGDDFRIAADWVVNAAGLDAQRVAARIDGFPGDRIPALHPAKGHYFALAGRTPFRHLIYPLPVDGGLGVHLTLDLDGRARFGPDVEWLDATAPFDYRVDASRAAAFRDAIRGYWPGLPDDALEPAYAGIRPKLVGPGQGKADFRIDGPAAHGCDGIVQLFGIESPGITASMAIARRVAEIAA